MKLLIILASILAVQATPSRRYCNGVYVKDQYYDKQILNTGLDRPFLLAVDYESDTLYFNYNINEAETRSARLNLKTNEIEDIPGIPNGFSHAVDSQNNLLYVGTMDGIYVYNFKTDQSEFYGAKGQFIWSLFFKDDVLYYSEFPSENFYTFSNGEPTKFDDLNDIEVRFFVLDDNNDMFFSNATGLFKQKKGSKDTVLYKRFTDHWDLRALTLDTNGNVYAGLIDGVYAVEKDTATLDRILIMRDVFGLAFDSDNNIIYADSNDVVRLMPSKKKYCKN